MHLRRAGLLARRANFIIESFLVYTALRVHHAAESRVGVADRLGRILLQHGCGPAKLTVCVLQAEAIQAGRLMRV